MAGLIDPTVTGDYPVILGDSLLDKPSNEIFTGIRYNHKPALSSSDAPDHARLKPSIPGKTSSYDLSYSDADGSYAFAGPRTVDDNRYVLYFDAERKAFILDKVDSTFNMNVTRLPSTSDPDKLARQFPHLEIEPGKADTTKSDATKDKPKPVVPKARPKSPVRKEVKRKPIKKQVKKMELTLPEPEQPAPKQTPKPAKNDYEEEDEEEEDGDGGLLVEYPGADASARQTDFSPAFPQPRRFDDFINQRESDGGDADEESDGEPDTGFRLPSPVNTRVSQPEPVAADDDDDLENDLEKEMEIAFEDLANSQEGSPGDESEISEED